MDELTTHKHTHDSTPAMSVELFLYFAVKIVCNEKKNTLNQSSEAVCKSCCSSTALTVCMFFINLNILQEKVTLQL